MIATALNLAQFTFDKKTLTLIAEASDLQLPVGFDTMQPISIRSHVTRIVHDFAFDHHEFDASGEDLQATHYRAISGRCPVAFVVILND